MKVLSPVDSSIEEKKATYNTSLEATTIADF